MKIIGVTGGMGCGKSTVLAVFCTIGGQVFDADAAVRNLYLPGGTVAEALRIRWGSKALDRTGAVDRTYVASVIFSDTNECRWLESLVHPLVREEMLRTAALGNDNDILYAEIPLLFESGLDQYCSYVITVWCEDEVAIKRLRHRGMSDTEIKARSGLQMDAVKKVEKADFVIVNNGTKFMLPPQCRRAHARIVQ